MMSANMELQHSIFEEVIYVPHTADEGGSRCDPVSGLVLGILQEVNLWETEEADLIFLDELPFDDDEVGPDGYYAYDEALYTLEIDFLYWCRQGQFCAFWPVFDCSYLKDNWTDDLPLGDLTPLYSDSQPVNLEVRHLVRFRRSKAWRIAFFTALRALQTVFYPCGSFFFIFLTLVGVGRSCRGGAGNVLVLTLSNTADLVIHTPAGLGDGCLAPTGDNPESTTCFFFSKDYSLVRQYAHHVRTQVPFNEYEYCGLLYTGETKRRKVTKQKPR